MTLRHEVKIVSVVAEPIIITLKGGMKLKIDMSIGGAFQIMKDDGSPQLDPAGNPVFTLDDVKLSLVSLGLE